jgi:hypothetical protein
MNMRNNSYKSLPNHVRIDRGSIFGNPFHMANEGHRDIVIEKYEKYFYERIHDKEDVNFKLALLDLVILARQGDLYLYCWCAPKKCHGDIIKYYIEKEI